MISEDPGLASWEQRQVEDIAIDRFYQKPWYEYHAMILLNHIDWFLQNGVEDAKPLLVACLAGELGRLSEQYYWRFRYEGAAMTGIAARTGASAGGQSKAANYRAQHSAWQKSASEIWGRRPELSKAAVAETIKKQSATTYSKTHRPVHH